MVKIVFTVSLIIVIIALVNAIFIKRDLEYFFDIDEHMMGCISFPVMLISSIILSLALVFPNFFIRRSSQYNNVPEYESSDIAFREHKEKCVVAYIDGEEKQPLEFVFNQAYANSKDGILTIHAEYSYNDELDFIKYLIEIDMDGDMRNGTFFDTYSEAYSTKNVPQIAITVREGDKYLANNEIKQSGLIFELINRSQDMRHYEGNFCATLQKESTLFGFFKYHPKEYIILKGTFDFSLPGYLSSDSSDSELSSSSSSDSTTVNETQTDSSDYIPLVDAEAQAYNDNID